MYGPNRCILVNPVDLFKIEITHMQYAIEFGIAKLFNWYLGNSDHAILEFRFVHANVAKPTSDEKMRYVKGDYAPVNEILKKSRLGH
jgi:hypothetical protein